VKFQCFSTTSTRQTPNNFSYIIISLVQQQQDQVNKMTEQLLQVDDNTTNDNSSIGYLIGTGLLLGVVHVLTGPDHLSALATLSANVPHWNEASMLGVRWGVGHSSGLLVVGIVLIVLSSTTTSSNNGQDRVEMPDWASHLFESIVGVFMLLLGLHGIRRAWLKRPQSFYNIIDNSDNIHSPTSVRACNTNSRHCLGDSATESWQQQQQQQQDENTDGLFTVQAGDFGGFPNTTTTITATTTTTDTNRNLEIHFHGDEDLVYAVGGGSISVSEPPVVINNLSDDDSDDLEGAVVVEQAYLDTVSPSRFRRFWNKLTRRLSTKTMAFGIGIVHGLAGPGGVLGVIPAVQLQNFKLATIYLTCFCVSSTLTMGCFATLYGSCSSKLASTGNGAGSRRGFRMECFSASLSVLVGITWLTLLAFGKLEDVFP